MQLSMRSRSLSTQIWRTPARSDRERGECRYFLSHAFDAIGQGKEVAEWTSIGMQLLVR
jgi:hypothetical protein